MKKQKAALLLHLGNEKQLAFFRQDYNCSSECLEKQHTILGFRYHSPHFLIIISLVKQQSKQRQRYEFAMFYTAGWMILCSEMTKNVWPFLGRVKCFLENERAWVRFNLVLAQWARKMYAWYHPCILGSSWQFISIFWENLQYIIGDKLLSILTNLYLLAIETLLFFFWRKGW